MSVTSRASAASKATKVEVRSPATGELLGTLPVHSPEDVQAAVQRARRAFGVWGSLSFKERRAHLLDLRREMVRRLDAVIDSIHGENGKPRADAASEVLSAVTHLTHAANRAERLLRPRSTSSGLFAHFRSRVSYEPLGVIGVIGPWNYPLHTPMGSIAYALAAGNTVVFKPSELTSLTGRLLAECAEAAIPIPDVLQVVTGFGETGGQLVRARVDKIAFTGSPATGRRVMAAAAETLTPVLLELGGKDAMIVAPDADLERAAKGAVFGALGNAGQACVAIERVYVAQEVYEPFVDKVVALSKMVTVGNDDGAHYGAMTMEKQIDIVRDHVKDALEKGARALVGGLDSFKGRFIDPIVLVDVTPEMKVMTEETFGPVLPIAKVTSVDEAVRLANQSRYGLGSAVYAKHGAERIAERLRAGMTSINSVMAYALIASLPFGGVGDSGFGRIHGDEGLLEFVRPKAVTHELFQVPGFGLVFGEPTEQLEQMRKTIRTLYGGSLLDGATDILRRVGLR
jgi:acyl-CoA reductase-like NAD-dependent aldehyde dehydrogenase